MDIIEKRQETFAKALKTLHKSLEKMEAKRYQDYDELRDSIIQRFEYCCDLFWKYLRDYLARKMKIKVEVTRPKPVYKECRDVKLISLEEYKICVSLLEDRNITSHGYHEDLAEEISEHIPKYYELMNAILQRTIGKKL